MMIVYILIDRLATGKCMMDQPLESWKDPSQEPSMECISHRRATNLLLVGTHCLSLETWLIDCLTEPSELSTSSRAGADS